MKKDINLFLLVSCLIAWQVWVSSCANIIPPTGGPRDSLPPKLMMSLPKDSATQVKIGNLTLVFNEFIELRNVTENLIISPVQKNSPFVDYKLKNLVIKLKDSLLPNTTYAFDFGNAIQDVNEGNIAKNFKFAFTTGTQLDKNEYSGKVVLAETGKFDSTLIVLLHKNLDDTAVSKLSPNYYTRVNGKGEFTFQYLPSGVFHVYAIPAGFSKVYQDSTQLFAFLDKPIEIGPNKKQDTLYAFQAFKKIEKPNSMAAQIRTGPLQKEEKKIKLTTNLENGEQDLLKRLTVTSNKQIKRIDSSQISLVDSNFKKIGGYHLLSDSSLNQFSIQYAWKENTDFYLLINEKALMDTSGNTLPKSDTIRFVTKKELAYGSIKLRFTNLNLSLNPVLQFTENEMVVDSIPLSKPEYFSKRYKPGNYQLRILLDRNANGKWDTGSFPKNKRQPEKVILISKPINIKANWDNDITIEL